MSVSTPHSVSKLLEDILAAGLAIQHHAGGMSEAGYLTSKTVRRAVEREFEIIGEALRRLAASHPETFRRITFATQIVSFRNVLAHGYDLVEDQLVWSIAEKRLPALLDEVRTLLAEEEARR